MTMRSDTSTSLGERVLIRYQVLFVALLLFLSGPFLVPERLEGLLAPLLFTLVALAALVTAAERRSMLIIGLLLAVPALLAGWLEPTEPRLAIAGGISGALFLALVTAGILNHVIRAKRVTSDLLFGVASVYLLLATIWSVGYGIADTIEPGAIALATEDAGISADLHSASGEKVRAYFSFVTLTTLGYGDIRPVSDPARIMAMLEATLGQLFLVIVVARIVGLYTVQARENGETQSSG
jgi:voltage-gated potassium channel